MYRRRLVGDIIIFSVCSAAALFRLTVFPSSIFPSSSFFFSFDSFDPACGRDRTSEKRRDPVETRRFVILATPVIVREDAEGAGGWAAAIFDRSINEMRRDDFCVEEGGKDEAEVEAEAEAEVERFEEEEEEEAVAGIEESGAERLIESFSGRDG